MAWEPGPHAGSGKVSTLDKLSQIKGFLSEEESQRWLAKFCLANPSFTVYLLTGVKLDPVQDLIIRTWFVKDYNLIIAGRGFSKTFMVALFIVLYAIAYPEVKIGIASGTFRQSKSIMNEIEKFYLHPKKGAFLRSCVTKPLAKGADHWEMKIGQSTIRAIPLGKVRGFRFNVLIADELLQIPKNILDSVIKPFLTVRQEGPKQAEIMKAQDKLVEAGELKKEDIRIFYPNNKIIGLSSASYKFDSLYKDSYVPYVQTILDPEALNVSHSVYRLSYRLAPKGYMEMSSIEDMKRSMSSAFFNRELEAIFTDDSGGYFSAEKIEEATLKGGEEPTILVKGREGKRYILGMDPNASSSELADDFAIAVGELSEDNETITLVHAYALPNSTYEKRATYVKYLLEYFNIVYIICDNAGGPGFFQMSKELGILPKHLDLFEQDFLNDNQAEGLANSRANYLVGTKMIHSQAFGIHNWLRKSNENLQWMIENKKFRFAAKIYDDADFKKVIRQHIPIGDLHYSKVQETIKESDLASSASEAVKIDFIDHLNNLIDLTKKEISLIELRSNNTGGQDFDLPKSMRRDGDPNKARKDSYSAALLLAWGQKCYAEMMRDNNPIEFEVFTPWLGG